MGIWNWFSGPKSKILMVLVPLALLTIPFQNCGRFGSLSNGIFGSQSSSGGSSTLPNPSGLLPSGAPSMLQNYSIQLVAGSLNGPGNFNGTALTASYNEPSGVAVDKSGNLYISDRANYTIRKMDTTGQLSNFAGSLLHMKSVDGQGSQAGFQEPTGLAFDSAQNLYVIDGNTVRKVDPSGVVTTLAGSQYEFHGSCESADGVGTQASFCEPSGLAVDANDNLYLTDYGNATIRKIDVDANVTTVAGKAGVSGSSDGQGPSASFNSPADLAMDASGNLYISDVRNYTIRVMTSSLQVSTLAGQAGMPGAADGQGSAATFWSTSGLAISSAGLLYLPDSRSESIRTLTSSGLVTTISGGFNETGFKNGTGSEVRFSAPLNLAADSFGNIYVADLDNSAVRKIDASGNVTTFAGTSVATFNGVLGLALDISNNVYVSDNSTIQKIDPNGNITLVAGNSKKGSQDGTGPSAGFNNPISIAISSSGLIYVSDSGNNTIRQVTPQGVVTTLVGTPGNGGFADGPVSTALLNSPSGIVFDATGNLYIADRGNCVIRKVSTAGVVSTVAGTPGICGSVDGQGGAAAFFGPEQLAIDADGNIYITDSGAIRRMDSSGNVSTIIGSLPNYGVGVGPLPSSASNPSGIMILQDRIYYTDENAVLVAEPQ